MNSDNISTVFRRKIQKCKTHTHTHTHTGFLEQKAASQLALLTPQAHKNSCYIYVLNWYIKAVGKWQNTTQTTVNIDIHTHN